MSRLICGNPTCDGSSMRATSHIRKFFAGEEILTKEQVIAAECGRCHHLTLYNRDGATAGIIPPGAGKRVWPSPDDKETVYTCCMRCFIVLPVAKKQIPELQSGDQVEIICPDRECFSHSFVSLSGEGDEWIPRRSHPHAAEDNIRLDGIYAWFEQMYP